ncbi:MAG: translation initiation factor IF-2 [Desulfovibrionales bacterium]
MSTIMRVRDLSMELGISNKDMLQLLRDSHIHVKSHMSGLTEDEVQMVKSRFKEKNNEEKSSEVVQKKVDSGVIVRRRKRVAPQVEEEPVEEAAPEEAPEPEEPEVAAEPVPAEEPAPLPVEAEVEAQPVPAQNETAPPAPGEEAPVEAEAEAEVSAPEEQEEPAPAPAPGVEEPEISEAQAPRPEKKKGRKKPAPPQVRVISKPEVVEKPYDPIVAARKAVEKEEQKEKEALVRGKRKKKKDRRVVDFSTRYAEAEDQHKVGVQFKQKKAVTVKDKTGGKVKTGGRRGRERTPEPQAQVTTQPVKAAKRKVKIEEAIRVADLAKHMGIKAQEVIKALLGLGMMATINQTLDIETATLVASEYGYDVEKVGFSEEEFLLPKEEDKPEELKPRSPVVTIMGHVDHGKTSLLDAIRKTDVTAGEAGGITQHIGAYDVTTPKGDIVFLDTPGHEAFTAMRARGAQVTDIVILVVAADDGVMNQTREAINHSKAAGVPILVAVNKIDKEGANPDRVKRELAEYGLVPEEWGGETIYANVSAKEKVGIEELLELTLLQSEVLALTANPNKPARGHIVEAKLDKGRGPVATVLVQEGTLHQGDTFVCGLFHGKVRAMFDDQGVQIKEAGPSKPIEVQGFDGVPEAGDEFVAVADERAARRIAEDRQTKQRERDLARENKLTLESFLAGKAEGEVKVLNLVLKADVQGSLEAIADALTKLSTEKIKINIIHAGAGAITESDIMLATASSGIIIGFNVRPAARIREIAEQENVDIRFYDIIYNVVNEIRDAMTGMLEPVYREVYLGQAEVLDTFTVPKVGTVAGCTVADGKLMRNSAVRLLREGVVIYTGRLSSLRRFKDDVKEVTKGYECGVGLERFNDIKIGDIIEAFEEVQEKATL